MAAKKSDTMLTIKSLRERIFFFKSYLESINATAAADDLKRRALINILSNLNFLGNYQDAKLLNYVLWTNKRHCKTILQEKLFDFRLDSIMENLSKQAPGIRSTSVVSLTPLGGISATDVISSQLYGVVKFIGQFTNDREIYQKCQDCVRSLPEMMGGLKSAAEVSFLMSFNSEIPNLKIIPRPKGWAGNFNRKLDFKESVHRPPLSDESEYDFIKKEISKFFALLAEAGDKLPAILLFENISSSYVGIPNSIEHFERMLLNRHHIKCSANLLQTITNIYSELSNYEFVVPSETDHQQKLAKEKVAGLSEDNGDIFEIERIISDCLIYVEDDADVRNIDLNKLLAFKALFEQNIVKNDSPLAHHAIREAVSKKSVWVLKYLINKGVTLTPPPYDPFYIWKFKEDTMTLLEILNDKFKENDRSQNATYLEILSLITPSQ